VIQFSRPFAAIRKDPRWVRKVLIASAVNLVPYVGAVAVIGWEMEYLRRVAWGADEELPEWKDWGRLALRGLWAFVAMLPYSLAISLIVVPVMMLLIASTVAWLISSGEPSPMQVMVFVGVVTLGSLGLTLGSSYLVTPLSFSAIARVALYDRLEAGFEFKEIWRRLRLAPAETQRAWLYTTALGFALVLPAMLLMMVPYGVIAWMALANGVPDPAGLGAASLIATVAIPLGYVVVSLVGVIGGLANNHWWGSQARVAYGLEHPEQPR
jgi:hypothetical protein